MIHLKRNESWVSQVYGFDMHLLQMIMTIKVPSVAVLILHMKIKCYTYLSDQINNLHSKHVQNIQAFTFYMLFWYGSVSAYHEKLMPQKHSYT